MFRYWLIFAQTVTICLALAFTISTIRPGWIGQQLEVNPAPTATVKIEPSVIINNDNQEAISPTATVFTSYADAVKQAAPSVVNIYTTKHINTSPLKGLNDIPALRPLLREQNELQKRLTTPTSLGSGVVANQDGYILTNYHVVEAADAIEVAFIDGRKSAAKFIGYDPDTDLAVLKVDSSTEVVPIHFDDKQTMNVGDVVLAIGNPFGVGQTTTMGIISALDRSGLGINTYENFIQTDAAINPGNSGGALINVNGNLIGINTAIYSESDNGGSLGIGFATPAASALKIMQEIIDTGSVSRGWLGVEPQDVTAELAKAFKLPESRGIIIASIGQNSPAQAAGLQVGDIIQQLNGKPAISTSAMLNEVANLKPGTKIKVQVLRSGSVLNYEVTLAKRPRSFD
ncbi:S1C family serine protease [Brackiella oedipodis]|uniref:S1C family serine protease n=1 Tax=Brackiella oedipodis TaxID=124225 RepID=UPI0004906CED|nr:trypsin-like peptidase domain-containing protein [Brackiella oedipodis]